MSEVGSGLVAEQAMQLDLGHYVLDESKAEVTLAEGTPNTIVSRGVGAPTLGDLAGSALYRGFRMDTLDEVFWKLPLAELDLDRSHDVHCRVCFETGANITPTGADWRVHLKGLAAGQAPSSAKTSPDGSLNYVDYVTTAGNIVAFTEWKAANCRNVFINDVFLLVACTLESRGSAAADAIRLLFVELAFTRLFSSADGIRQTT